MEREEEDNAESLRVRDGGVRWPGVAVDGPVPELTEDIRALHFRFHRRTG